MSKPLYQRIALAFEAMDNCRKSGNDEWLEKHRDTIEYLVKNHMPSGSGINSGTQFDFDKSAGNKLVFNTSFHHMDDGGMYDGWTDHTVTVQASLTSGFDIRISGRDRNDIKDYLAEVFDIALRQDIPDSEIAKAAA